MLEQIIIISLITIGYCAIFWEDMIFEKFGDWLEERLPEWLCKPLFSCYICACMWFGSGVYWLLWGNGVVEWLACCVGAMGFNAVVSMLYGGKEDEENTGGDSVYNYKFSYKYNQNPEPANNRYCEKCNLNFYSDPEYQPAYCPKCKNNIWPDEVKQELEKL